MAVKRLALLALALSSFAPAQTQKPRLVVLISIDQFRQDYIRRFTSDFLPPKTSDGVGGFRFLMETGADYMDAHHGHIPTATGPGHATLFTGSEPSLDGIVGNDWIDRETGKGVYCVDDPTVETVGGMSKPMSARNLLVSTVGDELKLATNGKGKVVGISLKDRAAILMAGHAADTVIWFDSKGGNWVSSSYYFPGKQLPQWVQDENKLGIPKSTIGKTWEPLLPVDHYGLTRPAPFVPAGSGPGFSHTIKSLGDFGTSRYGNDFLFDTVDKAITAEGLGQDDVPDVLVVNLASNDYVGHAYGPNSPEVMDMAVRSDRLLSGLFNTIDKEVKGGLDRTLIIVTADHGVLPIPEEAQKLRMPSERVDEKAMLDSLNEGLSKTFGEGKWVLGREEQNLYLNVKLMEEKGLGREAVENRAADLLADAPGVYMALTRTQILKGQVPATNWTDLVMRSFNPKLSGDLIVAEKPGSLFADGNGTSHGTPWAYDTHVPLLIHGSGVVSGRYGRHVYTRDIASTVCAILGIEYPTGNMGSPLFEMLKK
ncbi:MAG TPA: alkaline phosphatase family protein [Fimbriimonadaceae bacterium]|nr:alkaline phosphatase family protein [Fimbriimonadaceae bacterium]